MRLKRLFTFWWLATVVFFWVLDAWVASIWFHDLPFLDLLILAVPTHELYVRILIAIITAIGAGAMYHLTARQTRHLRDQLNSDQRLRALSENIDAVLWVASPDHRTLYYISPAAGHLWNLNPADMKGDLDAWFRFIHPADQANLRRFIKESIQEGTEDPDRILVYPEFRIQLPNGKTRWVETRSRMLRSSPDAELQILGVSRDITEARQIQEALRQSEERYRLIVEHASEGVEITQDDQISFANKRLCEMLEYSPEEIRDIPFSRIFTEEALEELYRREIERRRESRQDGTYETTLLTKHGRVLNVEVRYAIIEYRGRPATFAMIRDVTAEKEAVSQIARQERALQLSQYIAQTFLTTDNEEMYDRVMQGVCRFLESPLGFIGYLDEKGGLVIPAMSGEAWESNRGSNGTVIFPRDRWAGTWGEALKTGQTQVAHGEIAVPVGHTELETVLAVPMLYHDHLIGVFVVAKRPQGYGPEEIALLEAAAEQTAPILHALRKEEQQRREHEILQQTVYQSQKREALGTLVGGVAHEFNNILQSLFLYGDLVNGQLGLQHAAREDFDLLMSSAHRARQLVRQILTFSRKNAQEQKPIHLPKIIEEALVLIRAGLPPEIEIVSDIPADVPPILGDADQIHQIIVNLSNNAMQAMAESGGQLSLSLANSVGEQVELRVRDTGHGMDQSTADRIFDPFFTTRESGEGTGLGLSIVQGVVEQMGGTIEVHSQIGKGAEFILRFPVYVEAVGHEQAAIDEVPR